MNDIPIADDQVADNKTLQYELRKLRARVETLEKEAAALANVISPTSIKLKASGADGREYYVWMQATEHGSGIWVGREGGQKHPCVAIHNGFGMDAAAVGVWSEHDSSRPTRGTDIAIWADHARSMLQIADAAGQIHEILAENLIPGLPVPTEQPVYS